MTHTAKLFRLGKSTVVTIPKSFGLYPGMEVTLDRSPKTKTIRLKPKKIVAKSKEEIRKLVESLAGGFKGGKHYTPEEMSKLYDEDTYKI